MKQILYALCISLVGWQAWAGEVEDAYKHATEAVKTSKTAAGLDAVIEELNAVIDRNASTQNSKVPETGSAQVLNVDKLEAARSFVLYWQEYLAAKAAGYDDKAREIAGNLAAYPTLLLPRSELLAKAYEPKIAGDKKVSQEATPSRVVINLDQDGRVSIGKDAPVTLDEMKEALGRLKANNPNISLILRSKKNVSYQKIKDALEVIGSVGITNVAFSQGGPASSGTSPEPSAADATPAPQLTPAK